MDESEIYHRRINAKGVLILFPIAGGGIPKQPTDLDPVEQVPVPSSPPPQRDCITQAAADSIASSDQASTPAPANDEAAMFGREEALRFDEELMRLQWFDAITWDNIKDLGSTTSSSPQHDSGSLSNRLGTPFSVPSCATAPPLQPPSLPGGSSLDELLTAAALVFWKLDLARLDLFWSKGSPVVHGSSRVRRCSHFAVPPNQLPSTDNLVTARFFPDLPAQVNVAGPWPQPGTPRQSQSPDSCQHEPSVFCQTSMANLLFFPALLVSIHRVVDHCSCLNASCQPGGSTFPPCAGKHTHKHERHTHNCTSTDSQMCHLLQLSSGCHLSLPLRTLRLLDVVHLFTIVFLISGVYLNEGLMKKAKKKG